MRPRQQEYRIELEVEDGNRVEEKTPATAVNHNAQWSKTALFDHFCFQ